MEECCPEQGRLTLNHQGSTTLPSGLCPQCTSHRKSGKDQRDHRDAIQGTATVLHGECLERKGNQKQTTQTQRLSYRCTCSKYFSHTKKSLPQRTFDCRSTQSLRETKMAVILATSLVLLFVFSPIAHAQTSTSSKSNNVRVPEGAQSLSNMAKFPHIQAWRTTGLEDLGKTGNDPTFSKPPTVLDAVAAVGRLFQYHIPKDHFSNTVSEYKATQAGLQSLPKWLSMNYSTGEFLGVPLSNDLGRLYISVEAQMYSDISKDRTTDHTTVENSIFTIEVCELETSAQGQDSNRSQDTLSLEPAGGFDLKCDHLIPPSVDCTQGELPVLANMLFIVDFPSLSACQRSFLFLKASILADVSPSKLFWRDLAWSKPEGAAIWSKLLINPHKQVGSVKKTTILSYQIGCSSQFELTKGLDQQTTVTFLNDSLHANSQAGISLGLPENGNGISYEQWFLSIGPSVIVQEAKIEANSNSHHLLKRQVDDNYTASISSSGNVTIAAMAPSLASSSSQAQQLPPLSSSAAPPTRIVPTLEASILKQSPISAPAVENQSTAMVPSSTPMISSLGFRDMNTATSFPVIYIPMTVSAPALASMSAVPTSSMSLSVSFGIMTMSLDMRLTSSFMPSSPSITFSIPSSIEEPTSTLSVTTSITPTSTAASTGTLSVATSTIPTSSTGTSSVTTSTIPTSTVASTGASFMTTFLSPSPMITMSAVTTAMATATETFTQSTPILIFSSMPIMTLTTSVSLLMPMSSSEILTMSASTFITTPIPTSTSPMSSDVVSIITLETFSFFSSSSFVVLPETSFVFTPTTSVHATSSLSSLVSFSSSLPIPTTFISPPPISPSITTTALRPSSSVVTVSESVSTLSSFSSLEPSFFPTETTVFTLSISDFEPPTTLLLMPLSTVKSPVPTTTILSSSVPTTLTLSSPVPTTTLSSSVPTTTLSSPVPTTTLSSPVHTTPTLSSSVPTTTLSSPVPTTTLFSPVPTTTLFSPVPTTPTLSSSVPTTPTLFSPVPTTTLTSPVPTTTLTSPVPTTTILSSPVVTSSPLLSSPLTSLVPTSPPFSSDSLTFPETSMDTFFMTETSLPFTPGLTSFLTPAMSTVTISTLTTLSDSTTATAIFITPTPTSPISICNMVDCVNGECIDEFMMVECQCYPGWTGQFCETNIDDCVDDPCLNLTSNGCMDGNSTYTCICLPGYSGQNCEVDLTPCDPDPCLGNETCLDMGMGEFVCHFTPPSTSLDASSLAPPLTSSVTVTPSPTVASSSSSLDTTPSPVMTATMNTSAPIVSSFSSMVQTPTASAVMNTSTSIVASFSSTVPLPTSTVMNISTSSLPSMVQPPTISSMPSPMPSPTLTMTLMSIISSPSITPTVSPTPSPNNPPILLNPVGTVIANEGQIFQYTVPEETFYDPESGLTSNLTLSLTDSIGVLIPNSSWIQISGRMLEGVPLQTQIQSSAITEYVFILRAEDNVGNAAHSFVTVRIFPADSILNFVVVFFEGDFLIFNQNLSSKIDLISRLAFLSDIQTTDEIYIRNFRNGSIGISYHNLSIADLNCADFQEWVNTIYSSEKYTDQFIQAVSPYSPTSEPEIEGPCNTVTINMPPTLSTNEDVDSQFLSDQLILTAVLVPASIVGFVLLVTGIGAFVLYRRHRKERDQLDNSNMGRTFLNRRPIIIERDLDLPRRRRAPVILANDFADDVDDLGIQSDSSSEEEMTEYPLNAGSLLLSDPPQYRHPPEYPT